MNIPKGLILEKEAITTLQKLLPSRWITRNRYPDLGIDMEIEITEQGKSTGKILWVQIKVSEITRDYHIPTCKIKTNLLKYYESCRLPVLILNFIRSKNTFYYIFAQKYIKENLYSEIPNWKKQKYTPIKFSPYLKLTNIKSIESIATEGFLYITQQQLKKVSESSSAHYWLDGIPKSDDEELKQRILKALLFSLDNKHLSAIKEYEEILRLLTISPLEKMSVLLNLGNAYYSISKYDKALENYKSMLALTEKVSKKETLEGKSNALAGIGIILSDIGDLDNALKYHKAALKIHKEIIHKKGEADDLGNIGLIYSAKGELEKALKYHKDALKIDREIGYKQGEASDLGNIGLIYSDKGELEKALKYHKDALKIHREIGYKQGEANQMGNIGLIYSAKGELDKALKYHIDALKIDREIGYKQGEADDLGNIGLIYSDKGEREKALKYHKDAIKIDREIGYKQGEADDLSNIGSIYSAKGELEKALKYYKDALKIHREIGYKQGEANQLGKIGLIYKAKGELDKTIKYLKDALYILDKYKLVLGRDTIRNAIDSITKPPNQFRKQRAKR